MDPRQQSPQAYGQPIERPVAYDQYGNPLYAHPMQPVQQMPHEEHHNAGGHHAVRQQDTSPEAMRLHEESVKKYPQLNLSYGEYVIHSVERHPIGIMKIWAIAAAMVAAVSLFLAGFLFNGTLVTVLGISDKGNATMLAVGALILLISILVIAGALVATYVFNSNKFYLTNESIIQEVRETVFAHFDQTVTLANIEDVSYHQDGILPSMLNYGEIRLSTVGDESSYHFSYVADPRHESGILNNAVEAYKSGRPVGTPDEN